MTFEFKKIARKALVASVVAGAVLAVVPAVGASTASANEIGCTDPNFVHFYWHTSTGVYGTSCYANKSYNRVNNVWADRVDTGNNNINIVDVNGTFEYIPQHTFRTWNAGQEMHVQAIDIL
ncbi:beta/gamma crystallin domain-containing protein [Psychromicrobium sp. YIM B11713]|uniref:beta/gamma crystallin domain-containing protein n=1 Tax=Psychromicrobium sp. YIM B11713 TaxID=3145233 RepID=UPI00374E9042